MKKIIATIILALSALTLNAQISTNDSYAKQLDYLIKAGESNFDALYDGVIPINLPFQHNKYLEILHGTLDAKGPILMSTSSDEPYLAYSQFRLDYHNSSPYTEKGTKEIMKKIRLEIPAYFESFKNLPEYKVVSVPHYMLYTKNTYLYKNDVLLASYHDKRKGGLFYNGEFDYDLSIIIYEQPRTKILADESVYNGVFPTTLTNTTEPQVLEKKRIVNGIEYTDHWNGIFTSKGILKVGTQTFHGYGQNYDGTWYSENWEYGNVKFTPEGTTDVVCGYFKNKVIDLDDFYLRDNFAEKFKVIKIDYQTIKYSYSTNYSCNWVKNIYIPFNATRQATQNVKDAQRKKEIDASNAEYYKNNPQNTSTANNTVLTYCPICNGTGKVVDKVVTDTRFETTHYKTCPRCNGSGR